MNMSQGEMKDPMDLVNGVCARAASDAGLKARLLADPSGTLASETGLTIPDDWEIMASEASDGTVRVELGNEDIPEEYLELVSGGLPESSTDGGGGSLC
tara:strand:+ start:189 stop:485 length:297 start_codon:yes stop_codon:yes gene_type:complete